MLQFIFYHLHIKGTALRQDITLKRELLCKIKPSLLILLNIHTNCKNEWVFLSTKSLKHIHDRHIYDKNSPEIFLIILNNLIKIIKRPDEVRRNMESKRGDFLFIKNINKRLYFISIEVMPNGDIDVVSSSATNEAYLKKFTLLWSWGTANSPS